MAENENDEFMTIYQNSQEMKINITIWALARKEMVLKVQNINISCYCRSCRF
jgi:hypothetical protein